MPLDVSSGHRRLTPAAGIGAGRAGATGPPGWRWLLLLTSRGIVGIPLRYCQL